MGWPSVWPAEDGPPSECSMCWGAARSLGEPPFSLLFWHTTAVIPTGYEDGSPSATSVGRMGPFAASGAMRSVDERSSDDIPVGL